MDQAQHIIDYRPAVWNFKETWKQIVHYDARSSNAIERDGAVVILPPGRRQRPS